MIHVKATREGLLGGKTATGYVIDEHVPFVALPSTAALRLWVRVYNPATKKEVRAIVPDVGPWNTRDHAYVFCPATTGNGPRVIRPSSELGVDEHNRTTNGAGIDLGEAVWKALGMVDNATVGWEFIV